jgi:hypothetical protein
VQWKDFHWVAGGAPGTCLRLVLYAGLAAAVWGMQPPGGTAAGQQFGSTLLRLMLLAILIETWVGASRMFACEVRERTLGTLWLLPVRPAAWIWAKAKAVLWMLLPALTVAGLAVLLLAITWPVEDDASPAQFAARLFWVELAWTSAMLVGNAVLGAWFAALFTLVTPRAALPLTLVCSFFATTVLSFVVFGCMGGSPFELGLAAVGYFLCTLLIVAAVHPIVSRRLRVAAAA